MLLLAMLACDRPGPTPQTAQLPSQISLVARFADGGVGSLLIALGDPRDPPVVRYAEGVAVFNGSTVISLADSTSPQFCPPHS